jgi:hypothetical protein
MTANQLLPHNPNVQDGYQWKIQNTIFSGATGEANGDLLV